MCSQAPTIKLEDGLDLRSVVTTGSVLKINETYDEQDVFNDPEAVECKLNDYLGRPIKCFDVLEKSLHMVDENGFVKKKILEEGGGLPILDNCTVSIAFAGYWENEMEPFDIMPLYKPMVVDLKDNGLLPGLIMAVKSMLVGEMSLFLLTHNVMYGEMGIPPRIKPKAKCVFYIKLVKSILTPKLGKINFSEPNTFERVLREVRLLHGSGVVLSKAKNYAAAIPLFRKTVYMLHKCRLADEEEENIQEKTLVKSYSNLAVCYNKTKQPLKACIACNELNRLNRLWNNGKMLFQNAKALRMIGQFESAEKRLKKAMTLLPNTEELEAELRLLHSLCHSCNRTKLISEKIAGTDEVSKKFEEEVDKIIKTFKEDTNLCKLTLPSGLNSIEIEYIKQACIRENLFFNKFPKSFDVDIANSVELTEEQSDDNFILDKEKYNDETIEHRNESSEFEPYNDLEILMKVNIVQL